MTCACEIYQEIVYLSFIQKIVYLSFKNSLFIIYQEIVYLSFIQKHIAGKINMLQLTNYLLQQILLAKSQIFLKEE